MFQQSDDLEQRLEELIIEIEILRTNQDALLERISEMEMSVQITIDNQETRLQREAQRSRKQRSGLWIAICLLIALVVYFEFSKNKVPDLVTATVLMGLTGCVLTIASGKSELEIKELISVMKRD